MFLTKIRFQESDSRKTKGEGKTVSAGPDRTDPAGILTWDEYDAITKAYPRLGLMSEVKEVMCGFCRTKPATTYDNTVGEWGEMFVEGYSRDGHRTAELLLTCDLDEREV
ncbi:hypothetical protein MPH_06992 [Macrophomina phaseolina MS6]|uniref:Uncharacterized protein n=1 Tax=Macrophomina phaseolina (strain MS6) TaxID=1126212 RepID=K2RZX4_MACPH|nr:hypothetical protein MPH_06992 [Macrophomina phaseolina MS6]